MSEPIPLFELGQGEGRLPERRDAAANRRRILQIAEQLFEQYGVHSVSMADIAQQARVGKGTLYRNFNNKGELCLALMDNQLRAFQDAQLETMRQQSEARLPYIEQLARFLEALVSFSGVHLPLLHEVQQAGGLLGTRETQRPHFWQYMTVHGLLRKALAGGELPRDLDTAFVAEALLAPLAPHSFRLQRVHFGFDEARMAAGMRLFLDGLRCLSGVSA